MSIEILQVEPFGAVFRSGVRVLDVHGVRLWRGRLGFRASGPIRAAAGSLRFAAGA